MEIVLRRTRFKNIAALRKPLLNTIRVRMLSLLNNVNAEKPLSCYYGAAKCQELFASIQYLFDV